MQRKVKFMNVSREIKKEEAIKRMKLWGIYDPIIRDFEQEDTVSVCEPPVGAYYWIGDEKELKKIREFEEKYDALVYCVIRSFTDIGKIDHYMYVSDYPEEWEMTVKDIKDNYCMTYTINYNWNIEEFGTIAVKHTIAAGVLRRF